ncbi:hypothetical protein GC088_00060 [Arthrobacter sp. JZ12]|uniref:hypothetical protein n=1 Tax=Arthrobacter sp. JZ12 TaxID=2654190 RepID=UPI002B4890C5|nr:hypothetical protein [Arthrobacter sp. JZ12]WRH23672.1 hypothetical protein GC088_00060 [Arthrobacter sp. JZ12]
MKKSERVVRTIENNVLMGVGTARGWAAPRVDAARVWVAPRIERGIEVTAPRIQQGVDRASQSLQTGIATVTPRIQEGLDRVVEGTRPRIQQTIDRATPAYNQARDRVVVEYIPAVSNRLSEAADSASRSIAAATIPPGVVGVVTRVTGDKKAVKKYQKAAVLAAQRAAKDLKRTPPRKGGKGWLIIGIIAAAITGGIAVWRASQPVEDPWKTPAPVEPRPVSEGAHTDEAKQAVTDIKEAADRAAEKADDDAGAPKGPAV